MGDVGGGHRASVGRWVGEEAEGHGACSCSGPHSTQGCSCGSGARAWVQYAATPRRAILGNPHGATLAKCRGGLMEHLTARAGPGITFKNARESASSAAEGC